MPYPSDPIMCQIIHSLGCVKVTSLLIIWTTTWKQQNISKKGNWSLVILVISEFVSPSLISSLQFECCVEYLTDIVEAEMSQKLSWRDLFVQIELGVDIASLGIK